MNRKNKFRSIRTDMIICFSVLVLLTTTIFMFFSIRYTNDNLKVSSTEHSIQLMEQVNLNIGTYINSMKHIPEAVINNSDIKEYLFEESQEKYKKVQEKFQSILQVRKDIYNMAIIADNGKVFINNGRDQWNEEARLEEKDWYQEAKAAGEQSVLSSSHVQNAVKGEYKWVVTLSQGIVNPKTGKAEGLLFIDLNYDVISSLCESISLGRKGYVYILDQKGTIVYHPQQQLILSGVKEELLGEVVESKQKSIQIQEERENKIYTPLHSEETGWTIVGVTYSSELVQNEWTMRYVYVALAATLIILAFAMAFFMSNEITKPVKQLQNAMKEVQNGDFRPVSISVKSDNEIASLNHSFNRMTEHIDELIKKNINEQREKQKSEMKALQSQINPHFLYNTLDSIIWLIEAGDNENAVVMTSALARFFQQVIGNSVFYVTVWKELEYTRNYLIIQQMRYKDKLDFEIQVEEEIFECKIIKLILQPLVENSLYHGLKYKEGQGHIKITGYRQGDKLIIKVMDDGAGIREEKLKQIFSEGNESHHKYNGVGMRNIQSRIKLYYGEAFGLQVESEEGAGTTITVTIPYIVSEESYEEA